MKGNSTQHISRHKVAQDYATKFTHELDLKRRYSFGRGGAKSFIDQHRTARNVSFSIENKTGEDHVIAIGLPTYSMFANGDKLKEALNATAILSSGVIATDATGDLTVTGNDANRDLDQIIRTFSRNTTVFTRLSLQSNTADTNTPDTSNYNQQLQTVFCNPYAENVINYLNLSDFQSNMANSPQFAKVDFLKEGFHVQVSPENFILVTVKKNTKLSFVFGVGAEDSSAQRTYRDNRAANQVLSPLRKAVS